MEFLVTTDNNYVRYLCVTMISVFENHDWRNCKLNFHILYNKISAEEKWRISEIAEKYCQKVIFYQVPDSLFDAFPVGNSWPLSCMYILLAHNFLPKELDRVLYLDIDLIVNGDITQFYNLDFKENYLIASKEWYDIKNEPKDLFAEFDHIVDWDINEAANGRYFNSGVLLINLKKFRDDKIDVNYYVKKLSGLQNVFYDQGALCVCFAKQTLLLKTCIYNYRLAFSIPDFYNGENRYKNLIKTYKYYPIKAQIIHYCGNTGIKPWKLHLKQGDVPNSETAFLEIVPEYVPYIDIWWRYAELLPHETYLQIKEEADAQTAAYRMFWIIANARGYTFYNALHIDNLKAPEWGGRNNVVRGSDLNNYVVPKVYICGADISGTILNLPYEIKSGTPFRLTVKRLSSNTIGLTQILETDNDAMCIFVRHFGRQWGAWSIIASADFNERLVNLESKINEAEKIIQEYDLVKNSLSYKIGRFITYFPRKIYNLLRNK